MSQQEQPQGAGLARTVRDGEHEPVAVYVDECEEGWALVFRQGGGRIHLDASTAADLVAAVQAALRGKILRQEIFKYS